MQNIEGHTQLPLLQRTLPLLPPPPCLVPLACVIACGARAAVVHASVGLSVQFCDVCPLSLSDDNDNSAPSGYIANGCVSMMARHSLVLLCLLGVTCLLLYVTLIYPWLYHGESPPEAHLHDPWVSALPPESEATLDRKLAQSDGPSEPLGTHPTTNSISTELALAAMRHLQTHPQLLQRNDYPSSNHFKVVVDYSAHLAMDYQAFVASQPSTWAFVTAYLPQADATSMFQAGNLPPNQVVWAPPTALNLNTLWCSMNLFDVQLLLRGGDIVRAIPSISLVELVGNTLPLARTTYLVLPCDVIDEMRFVDQALQWVQSQHYVLGCRRIDVQVNVIAEVTAGDCKRQLLELRLQQLAKGTRHTWCYYTRAYSATGAWAKFVLYYSANSSAPLRVQRDANVTDATGWTMSKVITDWLPNVNFGDVLGWGLSLPQRLLLYWSMLQEQYWPDYNTHNWVVSQAAHIVRIDKEIKSSKKHPPGVRYVKRLRSDTCLPAKALPPEQQCEPCTQCIEKAEVYYRSKVKVPNVCRMCLGCLQEKVRHWEPDFADTEAYSYPTGTGWAWVTPQNWTLPQPCLTHVPLREIVDVRMCRVGSSKPYISVSSPGERGIAV